MAVGGGVAAQVGRGDREAGREAAVLVQRCETALQAVTTAVRESLHHVTLPTSPPNNSAAASPALRSTNSLHTDNELDTSIKWSANRAKSFSTHLIVLLTA